MADDLHKEAPAVLAPVVNALPEFVAHEGARPRQGQVAALAEGAALLVPFGTVSAWALSTYAPGLPAEVQGAMISMLVVALKFLASRVRDWRWKGTIRSGSVEPTVG